MGTGVDREAGWGDGPPGDGALIAAVAERRHEALAEIYRRHGGAVWSVAKRVCRGQAPDDAAAEVCEAVFAELWERPERFESARTSLRARLIAAAHARAVAVVRAAGPVQAPAPSSAAAELMAHAESLDADARRAVDQLATDERDALLLCYVGGRPCREAAGLLGVTEAAVKASVRTGLVNLRRALDAEGVSR